MRWRLLRGSGLGRAPALTDPPLEIMGALPSAALGLAAAAAICFLLSLGFAAKASVPKWRRLWGWGRGTTYPISLFSHIGISFGFAMLGLGFFAGYVGQYSHLVPILILAGFTLFIAAGILDGARESRRKQLMPRRDKDVPSDTPGGDGPPH